METLGQRIKRLRKEKGMTQEALAKASGSAQSTISTLEADLRGKRPDLLAIADALGVDVYYLRSGITRLPTTDPRIVEVAALMQCMTDVGKAIVLDKARDMAKEHRKASMSQAVSGE